MPALVRPLASTLTALTLAIGACDYEERPADPDAADAGPDLWVHTGALGADPASGLMLAGAADYSPDDPALARLADLIVLGGPGAVGSVHVVHGPNGPVLVGPHDRAPTADRVLDAPVAPRSPDDDPRVAGGRWHVANGRPIVIEGPAVDLGWATTGPSTTAHGPVAGFVFAARLAVDEARLPSEALALRDATVRVFDTDREVCIARVTGFELEARLVHEPLGPWDPTYSDAEIFARGLRSLTAVVTPLAGASDRCDLGVVAVGVGAPSPRLFAETETPRALHDRAIEAVCALPAWRAHARDDLALDRAVRWNDQCRLLAARSEVRTFVSRDGARFVVVDDDGFHAGLAADGRRLAHAWSFTLAHRPEGLIDVHGDGSPELVMPALERAPRTLVGLTFAGDGREPTYAPDWTPLAPARAAAGGLAVPDFSVFVGRAARP